MDKLNKIDEKDINAIENQKDKLKQIKNDIDIGKMAIDGFKIIEKENINPNRQKRWKQAVITF